MPASIAGVTRKRFMHAAKVIVHEVQSDHVSVVFQLLAESVREPVDWSRKDLSQYAGIARQNGGDVRQESGPVNALFTDKQVAYFSSVASLTIRAAAWLASSLNRVNVLVGTLGRTGETIKPSDLDFTC